MKIYESRLKKKPDVTVVTPVCNVEKYLDECLNSLEHQTLKNIEFVCINDGSTDNSLQILLNHYNRDPRYCIIDKPNSGYGSTMNLGFSKAKGEYIGIVESDDFAEPNMFKKLYSYAHRHRCDLVKCSYFEHSDQGDVPQNPFRDFPKKRVFNPGELIWVTTVAPIIWCALYKKSMITENHVRFNETPGASFQDTSFVFQCWVSAKRAALIDDCLLHYRVDNSGSSVKSAKKIFAVCDEYALSEKFLNEKPERMTTFGKIMQVNKLGTYKWNYERIDDASKQAFAKKMSEEFTSAKEAGMLDKSMFGEWEWSLLNELIDKPKTFAEHHPDQIYHS